mgnify:CR=1 FL=1
MSVLCAITGLVHLYLIGKPGLDDEESVEGGTL